MAPRSRRGVTLHDLTDKAVPEPIDRPQKNRPGRGVAKGASNLGHQTRQVRLLDERRRPQSLLQLGFRHGARPVVEEDRQQLERFRRKMDLIAVSEELPRAVVEHEAAETVRHVRHCRPSTGVRCEAPL